MSFQMHSTVSTEFTPINQWVLNMFLPKAKLGSEVAFSGIDVLGINKIQITSVGNLVSNWNQSQVIQLPFKDNSGINDLFIFSGISSLKCQVLISDVHNSDVIEIPNDLIIENLLSDYDIYKSNLIEVKDFIQDNREMTDSLLEARTKIAKYFSNFSLELKVHQDVDGDSTIWIFIVNDLPPAEAITKEMQLFHDWFKAKYIKFKGKLALRQVHRDGV